MPPDLHTAAVRYARFGWSIFPLLPRAKTPATAHGFKDASKDPDVAEAYWLENPQANIGVVTGAASGFDVLDIDVKKADGLATLDALVLEHGPLPQTPSVSTPSGGVHLYFLHAHSLGRKIGFRPGLDALGDNGYVVVPPSVTDQGEYAPRVRGPIAPWPPWLLDVITPPKPPAPTNPWRSPPVPHGTATAYGRAALRRAAEKVATAREGERNRELHFAAYSLARLAAAGHLAQDDVRAALIDAAATCGYTAEAGDKNAANVIDKSIAKGLDKGPRGPAPAWACR